jgi:carotenoid 1,2-hydratase
MNLLSGVEQDFHRPQKSPGAYEWWHFDGTDDKSGYSFSIQFHAGNLFSAYYQDNLKTYWEKTKSPLTDSSNPLDYCGVSFRLFHQGNMVVESLQEFPQRSLKASDKHGAVLLGPNRFNWDQRGDPPSYVLTAQAPLRGGKTTVRARLFFTPLLKYQPTLPQPEIPSTHTWILAAPLCHVEGTLEWVNREGESSKEVHFVGQGYHDHHFGSVPLDRFVKSWHWGRAQAGDRTIIYSVQTPTQKQEANEGIFFVFEKDKPEIVINNETLFRLSKTEWNIFLVPYNQAIILLEPETHGRFHMTVQHQNILSNGPAHLVFQDQLCWTHGQKGLWGSGMSNYLYTPRLSSRLFFPLLKGKSLIIRPAENSAPPPPGDVSTTRPSDF